jgi:uncharacterized membrane protein YeaQ/YmgE (transglycosylase-associated protein family)
MDLFEMDMFEIILWIALGLLLAALHIRLHRERLTHPLAVFASGVVGALIGGTFIRMLNVKALTVGGYSFAALLAAGALAEIAVLMALASRAGHHSGTLDG